jgi:SH3-like domain-containing protein
MEVLRMLVSAPLALLALAAAAAAPAGNTSVPLPRPKPAIEAALAKPAAPVPPPIVATGMPVPRWVTVKAERVNVRRGPSLDQEVLWTYVKPGVPVEVIAEYDAWRRIRDADGSTGWVSAALLDGRRNVMMQGRVNTAILETPKADAEAIAFAEPGLVAKLISCEGAWCEVSTRGYNGYVSRDRLWGVYEDEVVRP